MIIQHMFAIKIFFEYAERTEQVKENPMSALQFTKSVSDERMILTVEEIKAFLTQHKIAFSDEEN